MRHIVTIKRRDQPTVYYLSKSGLRCYTAKYVAVFRSEADARSERDYFAAQMPEFVLEVERLPAHVRNVARAVLSATPV